MKTRHPEHEVCTGFANLGAIKQHFEMGSVGVLAAHLQTVTGCFSTRSMTIEAVLNALPHFLADLIVIWHKSLYSFSNCEQLISDFGLWARNFNHSRRGRGDRRSRYMRKVPIVAIYRHTPKGY